MEYDKIRTRLEKNIFNELWALLEADIISNIISQSKVEKTNNYYKQLLEGLSFKVNAELAPGLNKIFIEVCKSLRFEEPIELFITNSPELNAAAVSSLEDGEPHIININSSIIETFDDEELRFIIGHELGHIISKNIHLEEIINFIFPIDDKLPMILYNKISLWRKLSELTADRYGLIACGSLEKCVSSLFKFTSGLDMRRINLDFNTFLQENDRKIEYFKNGSIIYTRTHPVNPIRIKALQMFFESELYIQVSQKAGIYADDVLFNRISELTNLMLFVRSSELDHYRALFIGSSGIVMATVDGHLCKDEIEKITSILANYLVFPEKLLFDMLEEKNYEDIFLKSARKVLEINPGERQGMFEFIINVSLSDNKIVKREIDFLYETGEQLFKYTRKEISQIIGHQIMIDFVPSLYK